MKILLSVFALVLTLSGCSDGGNKIDNTVHTGQLFFSGIEGLTYQTATQGGEVAADGTFDYMTGETVSFWLGDLLLIEGVPAKEFLTPLDFTDDSRDRLDIADVEEGYSTHKLAERDASLYAESNNITRLLLLMSQKRDDGENEGDEPIIIEERDIEQLNEALVSTALLKETEIQTGIDFTAPITNFEQFNREEEGEPGECGTGSEEPYSYRDPENSIVNKVLDGICFFEEDNLRCEAPPTLNEIYCAKSKFKGSGNLIEDYDETLERYYQEDLEAIRSEIINSKVSTADKDMDETSDYLIAESDFISNLIASKLYFNEYVTTVREGDQTPVTINILHEDGEFVVNDMEVGSTNENIAAIDGFSKENKSFTFIPVGTSGEETTLIINIKLEGDYRWYKKNYRVIID